MNHNFRLTLLSVVLTFASGPAFGQEAGFTYQGRLTNSGNPADGLFDMQFRLFDTAVVGTGTPQGATITNPGVQVTNAVFTVQLDFGAGVFTGEPRFLEIGVRPAGSADPYTILSPRQPLTSIPYAVRSTTATTADTAMNATQLGGQPASGFIQNTTSQQAATNFNIGGNGTVGGTLTANTAVVNGNVGIGTATPTERLDVAGNGLFTGNLTASGSISVVGMRTEINATSPNVMGGFNGNSVTAGVFGATIGGGGETLAFNRVTDNFGTIGGGGINQAGDNAGTTNDKGFATVGGGIANIASGNRSTVGGGHGNTASGHVATAGGGIINTASGSDSTVGGGNTNTASGFGSTVGGGELNTASGVESTASGGLGNTASGSRSIVPGGFGNTAAGDYSFAAGRRAKANHNGAFVWADSTGADFASTADNQFIIRASGGVGIGTTSPSTSLHVARNTSDIADPVAVLESEGNQIPLAFRIGATEAARIRADSFGNLVFATPEGTSKNIFFRAGDDSSTDMFIQSSTGRVGIGTTAPDQLLTVNGGASKPGGGSWSVFSDERLKLLKGSYSTGLEAVMQLQPIRYEYRADNELGIRPGGEQIGFAAQVVERVIPEAVTRNARGYLLVNNDPIMWAMLNAIKELKAENDSLKQRLDEIGKQKEEIRQQQIQIERLKKIICLSHPHAEGCK